MTSSSLTPAALTTPASGRAMLMRCAGIDGSPITHALAHSTEPPVLTRAAGKSAALRRLMHPHRRPVAMRLGMPADGGSEYAAFVESLGAVPIRLDRGGRPLNLLTERGTR